MGPRIPRMGRGPTDLGGRSISRSMNCVDAGVSVAAYPMDRAQPELVRVEFDRRLTLELHGSMIPSDADGAARSLWSETCFPVGRRTGALDIYGTACAYINALLMAFRYGLPGHPQHKKRRHGWL